MSIPLTQNEKTMLNSSSVRRTQKRWISIFLLLKNETSHFRQFTLPYRRKFFNIPTLNLTRLFWVFRWHIIYFNCIKMFNKYYHILMKPFFHTILYIYNELDTYLPVYISFLSNFFKEIFMGNLHTSVAASGNIYYWISGAIRFHPLVTARSAQRVVCKVRRLHIGIPNDIIVARRRSVPARLTSLFRKLP